MTTIDFFTKEELFEIAEYLEKKNKILNELNELKKDCDKHKEILIPINKEYEEIKEEIVKQLIQDKFIKKKSDIRKRLMFFSGYRDSNLNMFQAYLNCYNDVKEELEYHFNQDLENKLELNELFKKINL